MKLGADVSCRETEYKSPVAEADWPVREAGAIPAGWCRSAKMGEVAS